MSNSLYRKVGYYWLEGFNSFAASFFFVGFMFLLHREHGLGDLQKLWIGAAHGFLYVGGSWFAGRFGQRRGYFTALYLGFGGMLLSMVLGAVLPSLPGQLFALAIWTLQMCFTWTSLEALVSEGEPPRILANRIGLYNVVWAVMAAVGYFVSGWVIEHLGPQSLYWVPGGLHLLQVALLPVLRRRHDAELPRHQLPAMTTQTGESGHLPGPEPARPFLALVRLSNPFSYMAINTLLVVVPAIATRLSLSRAEATMWLSLWHFARAGSFVGLWAWHGWHYRKSWLVAGQVMVLGGFLGVMLAMSLWQLVLAQLVFGFGAGLLYYAALFYAMDGTASHGDHSGIHEALIGMGIGGGPLVSAVSITLLPAYTSAPAWAVGVLLTGALGMVLHRARRT